MKSPFFITIAAVLLLATTSILHGQDDKGQDNGPKEASVEAVAKDLSPELRKQIAELLSQEAERISAELETEQKELEQLRSKLKEQEEKVERSNLKLKFLKARLKQWLPEQD